MSGGAGAGGKSSMGGPLEVPEGVRVFVPYWGVLQVIQSTPEDADKDAQRVKQACIQFLCGKPSNFISECMGTFLSLSSTEELPFFKTDLEAADYLLRALQQAFFASPMSVLRGGDIGTYFLDETLKSYRDKCRSVIMLPGLDWNDFFSEEAPKELTSSFMRSAALLLGQGACMIRDEGGGFFMDPQYFQAVSGSYPDHFFNFREKEQREAGIDHCVGPDFAISKAWFESQLRKEHAEKEAGLTHPALNWERPWYQRPDARSLQPSKPFTNTPRFQLGVAKDSSFRLRMQNGLAILPKPEAIRWSDLDVKKVPYRDRIIELPQNNCPQIVQIFLAEDPVMGTVPIYYSGLKDPCFQKFSLPELGRLVKPSGGKLTSKDVDAFVAYYFRDYAGNFISPVHFDGRHTYIQLWALVNSAGLSSKPIFLRDNGLALQDKRLIFRSSVFVEAVRQRPVLRGEPVQGFNDQGLDSGALMLVNYGEEWVTKNAISDIWKTTPEGAVSICASPGSSAVLSPAVSSPVLKDKAKAEASLCLEFMPTMPSIVRPIVKSARSFATIIADCELAVLSESIDWEAENKKSQRENFKLSYPTLKV